MQHIIDSNEHELVTMGWVWVPGVADTIEVSCLVFRVKNIGMDRGYGRLDMCRYILFNGYSTNSLTRRFLRSWAIVDGVVY